MGKKKPGIMTPCCNLRTVEGGLPGIPAGESMAAYVMSDHLLVKGEAGAIELYSVRDVGTHTETEQRDKSAIGRAAVGGALLGPLGAVVGAASGIGTKTIERRFLDVYMSGGVTLTLEIVAMTPSSLARFFKALRRLFPRVSRTVVM